MENKKFRKWKKSSFPTGTLFLCGFLLGLLLPNLAWRLEWKQKAMASLYLLGTFGNRKVSGMEYLLEIIRMRGGYYLLCILCGFTVFGVPLAVLGMIIFGMELGAIFAMSLLQFGLAGGAACIGLLFPQYLVYIPVIFITMDMIFREAMALWKNHGIFPKSISGYCGKSLICLLVYSAGMLLECYVNPWTVEKILAVLKFF